MTFREYARSRGLNVSTVSRQVQRGQIPVVWVGGRRRIDPAAADAAREKNLYWWWGGRRTPGVRRAAPPVELPSPLPTTDASWAAWDRKTEKWLEEELRRIAPWLDDEGA